MEIPVHKRQDPSVDIRKALGLDDDASPKAEHGKCIWCNAELADRRAPGQLCGRCSADQDRKASTPVQMPGGEVLHYASKPIPGTRAARRAQGDITKPGKRGRRARQEVARALVKLGRTSKKAK